MKKQRFLVQLTNSQVFIAWIPQGIDPWAAVTDNLGQRPMRLFTVSTKMFDEEEVPEGWP